MKLSADPKLAYLTLLVSAVFYSLYLWLAQPPLVTSDNAPAREFSAQRAMSILEDLLQHNQPHPVGSAANQFVRSRIEARLDELGIGYRIQSTWACRYQSNHCARVENIIGHIPGDPGRESILLMAHYDSVPTSAGAGDDGAAVAAILETARALSLETPLARPVTLLFTDGEEDGLLGAEAFFADPALIQNIGAALNYEGSGSKGVSRVLRTAPEGSALIDLYQASAKPAIGNSISSEIFKRMPNDTDFSVVIRAGIKGIDFAFAEERNHYHSHNDSIQNLDLRTLQHHGNNMLPLVRQLLAADVIPTGTSLVYLDIYGQWLQWPDSWQPWLILMALLMLAIAARLRRLPFRQLASGCAISLAILISALVSGFAAFQLLTSVLGPLPGWPANSWGFRIVLFAAPLFGGLLIISLLKHRTTPANLFLTNIIWLFFISLFMVAVLPSAAINFLLALLPACLILVVSSFLAADKQMYLNLLAIIMLIPATLGLVYPVEATQGYGLVLAFIPGVALFTMFSAPFLFGVVTVLRRGSLLLTVLGLGWAVLTPLYSEFRPQPINFIWYQNQDSGQAHLTVRHRGRLPKPLNNEFSSTPKALLPFSNREFSRWRELPGKIDGGAGVTILDHTAQSVTLNIHTRKNIATISLYTPAAAGLIGYEIDGQSFEAEPGDTEYDQIRLTGLYGRAVNLKLHFETASPTEAYLVNHFYPLPTELQPFQDLRQPLGNPVHQGDQALSFRLLELSKSL